MYNNVSKNCVKEWYIFRTILFVVLFVPFLICCTIETNNTSELIVKISLLAFVFIFVAWSFIYAFIFPKMQYKRLKIKISETEIEKQSGVIFLRRQFVPTNRIQHIELYRGVLDRAFKMSTILLFTAGSIVRIQNIDVAEADELIHQIKTIVQNDSGDENE